MTPNEVVRTRFDEHPTETAPVVAAEEALSLPPSSPARRAFLQALIREAVDAVNRGDVDAYLSMLDPDLEVRIARLEGGGVWGGDFDELYRGREGMRRLLEQWLEPWEEIRLDPHEILDLGGDSFVALGEWVGRGRGSGVEVRTPWPARFTLRGRLTARVDFFPSREGALAAMGLDA
jgi:ketosteroid isomerase-like protein